MYKIDFFKKALDIRGYVYEQLGDFQVQIEFENCTVVVWETLSENLYFKVIDLKGDKVFAKTYKTINNIFKYGFKNIII